VGSKVFCIPASLGSITVTFYISFPLCCVENVSTYFDSSLEIRSSLVLFSNHPPLSRGQSRLPDLAVPFRLPSPTRHSGPYVFSTIFEFLGGQLSDRERSSLPHSNPHSPSTILRMVLSLIRKSPAVTSADPLITNTLSESTFLFRPSSSRALLSTAQCSLVPPRTPPCPVLVRNEDLRTFSINQVMPHVSSSLLRHPLVPFPYRTAS